MSLLEVSGGTKKYGVFSALKNVDVAVEQGTFHELIGPNGSGKSTLLKAISGAHLLNAGTVSFDATMSPTYRRARMGMSLKFQITAVLPELSLFDNLLLAKQAQQSIFSLARLATADAMSEGILNDLERFGLRLRTNDRASILSHGQQQWLEIAMAIAQKPRLLLLGEPTGGMSVEERRATGEFLQPLKSATTLITVEHDLDFIRTICDSVTVLDQGRVVYHGSIAGLDASEDVKRVYTTRA